MVDVAGRVARRRRESESRCSGRNGGGANGLNVYPLLAKRGRRAEGVAGASENKRNHVAVSKEGKAKALKPVAETPRILMKALAS